jgi:phosphoenolpyruvate carboxykinase (GTP)
MIALPSEEQAKIDALENPKVIQILNFAINLMQPEAVQILTDDPQNRKIVRDNALKYHEETTLTMPGHTLHYDGYNDQGRDREHTAVLLPAGQSLSRGLTFYERESSLKEVFDLMKGAMKGRTMIVRFYSLGPLHSIFSLLAMQITDSYYVTHSEDILYRPGYEMFKVMKNKDAFFYFLHSAGELDTHYCSKNVAGRRIYIDPLENRVLSINNQYAGNSLACKKLALRLAINKANNEDWLAEHYFISAFSPLHKKRKTYFAGAYPSACGKTSTAMIPGAIILGDDIAYLKIGKRKEMRAVNIEQGIFGIIQDVNSKDDPVIYRALTTPKELIFKFLNKG